MRISDWSSDVCSSDLPTLSELARKIGVDPAGLERTVAKMNQYSALGVAPEFGMGNEEIDREIGDPKHKPHPCLGPVEKAPFYAIKIYPGAGSTTVGVTKCVAWGESVSVHVDLGVRRIINIRNVRMKVTKNNN